MVWIFPQEPHSFPSVVNTTFISILNSPVKLCFTKDVLSTQETPLNIWFLSNERSSITELFSVLHRLLHRFLSDLSTGSTLSKSCRWAIINSFLLNFGYSLNCFIHPVTEHSSSVWACCMRQECSIRKLLCSNLLSCAPFKSTALFQGYHLRVWSEADTWETLASQHSRCLFLVLKWSSQNGKLLLKALSSIFCLLGEEMLPRVCFGLLLFCVFAMKQLHGRDVLNAASSLQ